MYRLCFVICFLQRKEQEIREKQKSKIFITNPYQMTIYSNRNMEIMKINISINELLHDNFINHTYDMCKPST